jgi:hypothetical protein
VAAVVLGAGAAAAGAVSGKMVILVYIRGMKPFVKALCILFVVSPLAASAQEKLLQVLPLEGQQVIYDTTIHARASAVELTRRAQKIMSDERDDSVEVLDRSGGSEIRGLGSFYVDWIRSSVQSTALQVFYTMDISVKDSAYMIRLRLDKVGMVGQDPGQEMSVRNFAVRRKSKPALEEMDNASLRLLSRCIKVMGR